MVMAPYLCISPVCQPKCSGCARAISNDEARKHAVRYLLLERMDPRFGMPAEWLRFATLREAVDAELEKLTPPDELADALSSEGSAP